MLYFVCVCCAHEEGGGSRYVDLNQTRVATFQEISLYNNSTE